MFQMPTFLPPVPTLLQPQTRCTPRSALNLYLSSYSPEYKPLVQSVHSFGAPYTAMDEPPVTCINRLRVASTLIQLKMEPA